MMDDESSAGQGTACVSVLTGADSLSSSAPQHFAVEAQGNPAHAPLGNLVVWNDDEIAPHSGFPMHGHRDMEIVTFVRKGVLEHEDSSGGRAEIGARNVQVITAGRGMRHSEYNDTNVYVRIFQIWLLPRRLAQFR
jgi:quercetin 2,3-dioxygenase